MAKKKVYLKFERFGLCNKIIMWAKAYVFAQNNDAVLITSSWFHIPIGNILRREKSLRLYFDFFNNKQSSLLLNFFLKRLKSFTSIEKQNQKFTTCVFEGTPYVSDLVKLAEYRDDLIKAFLSMIKPMHKKKIAATEIPVIGVHVRRGDFNNIGATTTNEFYVDLINKIRSYSEKELPVTIFSDGFDHELKEILELKNTKRFETQNDLVDLVVLSKSKILITSKGSSYSYWAAFIGDATVLHHPDTWVPQCRDENTNRSVFEGPISADEVWPNLLLKNIKSIS